MPGGEFRFGFFSTDYEATVAFYRDSLELPVVGGWDQGLDSRGTLFSAGSGVIEAIALPPGREFAPPEGAWLVIEVEDVDRLYQRALQRGLRIRQELTERPWGAREFKVFDPSGIIVVLFSPQRRAAGSETKD
jgi:catechol 2,3-dioxygenase-like lactoylglutathione lyase family enzyme